ncbi:hypothetical protein [Candidatus Mycoplasma haematohominis]|uniref:Uncharacterized protein n=1 Tax=Candidatus Mycoplasma haematohominis TaxID=1494318 RepID=A0A478FT88_9MOLU|nr:hypothetical protein [Candidatus Mycoplasma haemohominis]GCE63699.1 hypothetical protein MHSWG343_06990 [Candidatus Mycoplasma haemohominis]
MSTQTIGAAAAGTAVVGGGGALAAYAAGAFSSKVEEQKQEESRGTYRTLVGLDESMKGKEYIGNSEDEIKKLWANEDYRAELKKTHWKNMEKRDISEKSAPIKTHEDQFVFTTKKNEVARYISTWCQSISAKELSSIPKTGEVNQKTWEAFKFACFK